jgi:hypothetical protein
MYLIQFKNDFMIKYTFSEIRRIPHIGMVFAKVNIYVYV